MFWGDFSVQKEQEVISTPFDSPEEISNYLQCSDILASILWERGIKTVQHLEFFLNPQLSQLPDPFSLYGMEKAVSRIIQALENDENLWIYGDYDVDGTCGSTLLYELFEDLGFSVEVFQPDRFKDGYGVHVSAVEKLANDEKHRARVILTVDCGITAVSAAEKCKELGIDFIVLDHHQVGEKKTEAYAIVNPQQKEDGSQLKNICGTTVAFFFAVALRQKLREKKFFDKKNIPEPNLMKHLDLVAVATVADVMNVRGVNRILLTHGLKQLRTKPRVGLKALFEAAGVQASQITTEHCGFVIGPRINAAGRLSSAKAAFELLKTKNSHEAKNKAAELEVLNKARRETQDHVLESAIRAAELQILDDRWQKIAQKNAAVLSGPWPRVLILKSPDNLENADKKEHWHEGVLGIVATKVSEHFNRPVFILAPKEDNPDILKGSYRSFGKIDLYSFVQNERVSRYLTNFGGHAHAGGVAMKQENYLSFIEELNLLLGISTQAQDFIREMRADAEIELKQLTPRLLEEIRRLEPFGSGFREPIFKTKTITPKMVKVMKEKHLKVILPNLNQTIDAVWFNAKAKVSDAESYVFYFSPGWNEFNGVRRLQLQLKHVEPK